MKPLLTGLAQLWKALCRAGSGQHGWWTLKEEPCLGFPERTERSGDLSAQASFLKWTAQSHWGHRHCRCPHCRHGKAMAWPQGAGIGKPSQVCCLLV